MTPSSNQSEIILCAADDEKVVVSILENTTQHVSLGTNCPHVKMEIL